MLEEEQRGTVLDGLVSNVDWVPTMLAFAGVVSTDTQYMKYKSDYVSMQLDGVNLYSYIMSTGDSSSTTSVISERDHILFHLKPKLTKKTNEWKKDITEYTLEDMSEIALIFYDNDGQLWKYFNAEEGTNPLGDPLINSGWCEKMTSSSTESTATSDDDNTDSSEYTIVSVSTYESFGLYNLDIDISETSNYLTDDSELSEKYDELYDIINNIVTFYVDSDSDDCCSSSGSNNKYLYGQFTCFTDSDTVKTRWYDVIESAQAYVPFLTNDELMKVFENKCGISKDHTIYQLHNESWKIHFSSHNDDDTETLYNLDDIVEDFVTTSDIIENINKNNKVETRARASRRNLNDLWDEEKGYYVLDYQVDTSLFSLQQQEGDDEFTSANASASAGMKDNLLIISVVAVCICVILFGIICCQQLFVNKINQIENPFGDNSGAYVRIA